ncbi:MAG TPA: immunity 22 family protein [Bacillales bacterium]|nr:immunity 22 family protein [Bacillales bacterium]
MSLKLNAIKFKLMYMDTLEIIKKSHIWMGSTSATQEEYEQYFVQHEGVTSQFYKDLGLEGKEYNEDFIGIIPLFTEEVPVYEILRNEVVIDNDDIPKAVEACHKLGIYTANAVFYLSNSSVKVPEPDKLYNGLKYIGIYESGLIG